MLIYAGSTAGGEGISILSADSDGSLTPIGAPVRVASPTLLIAHHSLPVLYAVNTVADGAVCALGIDDVGGLVPFSQQPSGGVRPLHAAVTEDGRYLICAHLGEAGAVAVLPLRADGSLEPPCHVTFPSDTKRAIAHHISIRGEEVAVACLGLGELRGYRIADEGTLALAWTAPAAHPAVGPRHVARHPNGTWFVSDEMASTVSIYRPDPANGGVRLAGSTPATRTEPSPDDPNRPSEIAISDDGRFVYVANRSADTIAVFAVNQASLAFIGESPTGGVRPRHFALAGSRLYVANERSDEITMLTINPQTGMVDNPRVAATVAKPTCVLLRGRQV